MRRRGVRRVLALALTLALLGCAPAQDGAADRGPDGDVPTSTTPAATGAPAGPPNVVLVLMDDFSTDLLPTLRSAAEMRRRGASYPHAYTVDSMCCVSRASLLTGQYPHQTGVLTNISGATGLGGYPAWVAGGNAERSVNVALAEAGWTTGFIGKYLNEYEWNPGWPVPELPPGWDQFQVLFGSAYAGWEFGRTQVTDGQLEVVEHHAPPASASEEEKDAAYAGTVTHDLALDFIRRHERRPEPYFLEVATYAPHSRVNPQPHYPGDPLFPAAFADRPGPGRAGNCGAVACADLSVDDLPGHGDRVGDNGPLTLDGGPARAWNTVGNPGGTRRNVDELRQRAMMAQSVDRMVSDILAAVGENTYVVLTSDNGFHLGQVGMAHGKGTAYATDSRVPMLVVGPGVAPGERGELVSTLDVAPTVLQLAGVDPEPFRAGRSMVPSLRDASVDRGGHVFLEHTQQTLSTGDPDAAYSGGELDRIPSYVAVRDRDSLLVRYDLDPSADGVEHGYEFYSYDDDSFERTNRFADPAYAGQVADLMARLRAFDRCAVATGDQALPASCRASSG
ncbi:MAG: sulfatase-like hydrolase/transferase [Nocardioides sp.]|uniref:sulfatase-like hydrolase/transferase n=1 Tax=Nocardioides sp. TaxID=35761 RepID=UPI003F0EFF05